MQSERNVDVRERERGRKDGRKFDGTSRRRISHVTCGKIPRETPSADVRNLHDGDRTIIVAKIPHCVSRPLGQCIPLAALFSIGNKFAQALGGEIDPISTEARAISAESPAFSPSFPADTTNRLRWRGFRGYHMRRRDVLLAPR